MGMDLIEEENMATAFAVSKWQSRIRSFHDYQPFIFAYILDVSILFPFPCTEANKRLTGMLMRMGEMWKGGKKKKEKEAGGWGGGGDKGKGRGRKRKERKRYEKSSSEKCEKKL